MISPKSFIHPHALVDNGACVGAGSRVWAFAHVVSGAVIGEDCNICDHAFIEGNVRVGNRVTIKCGVYLWDGVIVEDDVLIGPCAAFTNDFRPRSKSSYQCLPTILHRGCSIGANSTILPGLEIGRWALVGAGAVVTHNVPDHALVMGNPARFHAWICCCTNKLDFEKSLEMRCSCGRFYHFHNDKVIEESYHGD